MGGLGAFLKARFGRPEREREAAERIKAWARAALQAHADTAFAVNEIVCPDPACPGTETVILVMEPGVRTRAYKVAKPLDEIVEQDIVDALNP